MNLFEKKVDGKVVYDGRILRVEVDKVELPNGKISTREIIRHPGGVGILALDNQGRIAMVRQYRYAFSKVLLEIPAGKLEAGENPEVAAKRELKEEVGVEAKTWISLGGHYASPGCYDEILHLYIAKDLSFGDMNPDEDEFLDVSMIPFQDALSMAMCGEIKDGKSVIAILKAAELEKDTIYTKSK